MRFECHLDPSINLWSDKNKEGTFVMPQDGYLDYVELPGSDIPATKAFYGAVFGWSFTDYGPDYVAFETAGRNGGFNAERKVVSRGGPLVVLYAADLDSMEAKVAAAGIEIIARESFAADEDFISAIPTATKSQCGRTSDLRADATGGSWRAHCRHATVTSENPCRGPYPVPGKS